MKQSSANTVPSPKNARSTEQAYVRVILLVLACFLLGVAVSALWYNRNSKPEPTTVGPETTGRLSDSTKAVLKRLDFPLEIRFYALLDPASVPDSVQAFAGRVGQLLDEYQREAGAKITVVRFNSLSDSAQEAASLDGIIPFNLDKDEACYLGLTVAHQDHKESLPQLAAEWEPALESDLTRAILRVLHAKALARQPINRPQTDLATTEEVKRAIPNLASVSVEEGKRLLRETALTEFTAAAREMQTQVQEAQQRLHEAQNGKSEAEQQTARKHLQQVQAEQTEKLKQIAARLQAKIAALEQLKGQ